MSYLPKAEEAAELRARGLKLREIAARLGVSVSWAGSLVSDPTGEKERARKMRYSRECLGGCGRRVNTDGRTTSPAVRCVPCEGEHQRAMTRQWFFDSVKDWVERFGCPPSSCDWNPAMARGKGMAWKAERHAATGRPWPSVNAVVENFGSWNAGLEAAGFPPVKPGEYRDGRSFADIAGGREKVWTPEAIFGAIDRWRDTYGTMPTSTQWHRGGEDWRPVTQTVQNTFGSWSAGIVAYVERDEGEALAA